MNKPALWTRSFVFSLGAKFFSSITFALLNTVLAAYAIRAYGTGTALAGASVGIFVVAALISRPLAGAYVDVVGRRKMMLVSCALYFVLSIAYMVPIGLVGLLLIRFAHGIAFGFATNTLTVVVTRCIPPNRLGEGLGYFSLATTLANAAGPFVGIALFQADAMPVLFAACSACSLLSFIGAALIRIEEDAPPETPRHAGTAFSVRSLFDAKALPFSLAAALLAIPYSGVVAFAGTHAGAIGTEDAAPWFFIVYSAALCATRPCASRLGDRKGERIIACPAIGIMACGLLVLGLGSNAAAFLVAAALLGIGFGNAFSSFQILSVKHAEPHQIGMATSTFYVLSDAGLGIGPILAGGIMAHTESSIAYLLLAGFTFLLLCAFCASKADSSRKE